jgi:hypothetical protein
MTTEFIVIALVGVIVLGLVFWKIFKGAQNHKVNRPFLVQTGFVNCSEEKAFLEQTVAFLEQNAEYSYGIDDPMKTSIAGRGVYFYTKKRNRHGKNPYASHEFLITLKRKVTWPYVLYCKPSAMSDGMGVKLLKTVTTANWDAQPDDLFKVALPIDYKNSNILGVLGPEGSSFSTLINPSILSLLTVAGDHGILVFRCRENICSFDNPGGYLKWDFPKVWSFVQQLVRQDSRT